MKLQNQILNFLKGGKVEKSNQVTKLKSVSENLTAASTPLWIGTTVVFALLFFLSSVLDMKVKVTFGQGSTGVTQSSPGQVVPTQSAPSNPNAIPSQVGGC